MLTLSNDTMDNYLIFERVRQRNHDRQKFDFLINKDDQDRGNRSTYNVEYMVACLKLKTRPNGITQLFYGFSFINRSGRLQILKWMGGGLIITPRKPTIISFVENSFLFCFL